MATEEQRNEFAEACVAHINYYIQIASPDDVRLSASSLLTGISAVTDFAKGKSGLTIEEQFEVWTDVVDQVAEQAGLIQSQPYLEKP